jgi:hypothetical protein
LDNDNFYRNPNRDAARVWSSSECAKYYFCVEGEIFKFEYSTSLAFDINRQICDFKDNVANCDVTAEETTPRPLFNTDEPICPKEEHACADGTCLPTALFCDGHAGMQNPNDCPIHGTFYVSHEYTNYAMVNKLANQGHEIAVHSITHRSPESWWDGNATIEDWFDEMVGQV